MDGQTAHPAVSSLLATLKPGTAGDTSRADAFPEGFTQARRSSLPEGHLGAYRPENGWPRRELSQPTRTPLLGSRRGSWGSEEFPAGSHSRGRSSTSVSRVKDLPPLQMSRSGSKGTLTVEVPRSGSKGSLTMEVSPFKPTRSGSTGSLILSATRARRPSLGSCSTGSPVSTASELRSEFDDTRRSAPFLTGLQDLDSGNASASALRIRRSCKNARLEPLRVRTNLPRGKSPSPAPCVAREPAKDWRSIRRLQGHKIFDLYYWEDVLQEDGDGGKVVICRSKSAADSSRFDCVMKMRSKATILSNGGQAEEERFRKAQERMLNFPPHAGVVPLREVLEDSKFYYIVMEKATGGSFFESLLNEFQDGVIPANAMRQLMRDILDAVRHLHDQGVLHRDIKPDNLVMQARDASSEATSFTKRVMLIDFDHADPDWRPQLWPSFDNSSFYGTFRFNAPETFSGCYSVQSDLYSVGVILFLLMTGKMPYSDETFAERASCAECPATPKMSWQQRVYYDMKRKGINFKGEAWTEFPACMDFCQKLLSFKPGDRPESATAALSHPWLATEDAMTGTHRQAQ